ncbi:hypothetical protein ACF3NA_07320 [Alkanindiges sp. WGS2144]|uniref:hypothetical protein n=1 Tax=Alkanindiges sp. WGS2144 TaxID=3366808 RepID=UPI003750EFC2
MTEHSQSPQFITVDQEHLGGHAVHWQLLSTQPDIDVPKWLQQALTDANMPYGLNHDSGHLPQDSWLINGPDQMIQISQLIKVNSQQQPVNLLTAFPIVNSPYTIQGTIKQIICCKEAMQAVLNISTSDNATIYAFDNLYTVNQNQYKQDQVYNIELGGFAYGLETVKPGETIVVDDPAAIKHHRALNEILANNNGIVPDDLQAQIAAWQPQTEEDKAPVTLDLSKMVAYLYGDHLGQEDEAWFQGEILGLSQTNFMDKTIDLIDVVIIREQNTKPVVIRLAYLNSDKQTNSFNVGDYIRGNIWIQATIYATNTRE